MTESSSEHPKPFVGQLISWVTLSGVPKWKLFGIVSALSLFGML